METTTANIGQSLLVLDPLKSKPTPKKVEEIISKILKIPLNNDLKNKLYDFYEEISEKDLTQGQIVSYFLRHSKFFFKNEPDIKDLDALTLDKGTCEPTEAKLRQIIDYIALLAKKELSPGEQDAVSLMILSEYRISTDNFPKIEKLKSKIESTLRIQLLSEDLLSADEASKNILDKNKQKAIDLALSLKLSYNRQFSNGQMTCIINKNLYNRFVELGHPIYLQNLLQEFEKLGYKLAPHKDELHIICETKTRINNVVQSFSEFVGKFLSKEKFVDVNDPINFIKVYKKAIDSGLFNGQLVFGVDEVSRQFIRTNPVQEPGAIYVGGMGSGKSLAMRFTALTDVLVNSENTLYFFFDGMKGMADFSLFFNQKTVNTKSNIFPLINEDAKFENLIDYLYQEYEKRKELFTGSMYTNIIKHNEDNARPLAQIRVYIEEFYSIVNSTKYHQTCDLMGSTAHKFKTLMRAGRSYGITFNVSTPRATKEDIPGSLYPGLSRSMIFHLNNPADANYINMLHAQEIQIPERGRCATGDNGDFIQFPYIDDGDCAKLLKEYYKPLKAHLLVQIPTMF